MAAGLVLLALLTAVHYDVVFQGRSLVLTNHSNPLDYRFLPENYGTDLIPPSAWMEHNLWPYANIRDPGGSWWQWEPGAEFLERSLARREWPFWDPYIGGGAPAMANLTSAPFFPPYAVLVVAGHTASSETLYLFVLLWLTGFFAYLFLRQHDLGFLSSTVGAGALLLTGAVNQHIGTIMGQTAACLTPVLYVTRRFLDGPSWRRTALLALVYAAAALASFPPLLVAVFGLAAAYALTALLLRECRGAPARAALLWGLGVALSVGLVAFYYLPAAALTATAPPQVAAVYNEAGLQALPPDHAAQILSPAVAGGVLVYVAWPLPGGDAAHLPYVGAVILMLAGLAGGGTSRRTRLLVLFSAAVAVLLVLKLFGVPPVQWLGRLPGLDHIHFAHYFGIPLGFLLAFLCAAGFEHVQRGTAGLARVIVVAALTLLAVEYCWSLGSTRSGVTAAAMAYWIRDWKVLAAVAALTAMALVAAAGGPRHSPLHRAAVPLVIALLVAEGLYNNVYTSPRRWDIFDHPSPYMRFLDERAGLARVMAYGAPNANLNSAFEVFTMDSLMAFNPPRAHQLYATYAAPPPSLFMREAKAIPPEPVLDREGVRLLGIRDAFPALVQAAEARRYRRVYDDGYVSVFERDSAPRFFFSSDYEVASGAAALELVAREPWDRVILEQAPDVPPRPNQPGDPPVRVVDYGHNRLVLEADARRPGLVYASDNYFDGWTATVNGRPAPILVANYAFRAVAVPAGPVRVEFQYWPPGLTPGLAVSGVSVLTLAGGFGVPLVRRRRWGRRAGG